MPQSGLFHRTNVLLQSFIAPAVRVHAPAVLFQEFLKF